MTNESRKAFAADKVRALATIILTRRSDLTFAETKKDTGLDFHVFIDREDKPMRLMFGILLRAVWSPMTPENANKVLGRTISQFRGMGKFTYPVCLFFFTMREEEGFFSWLAEPIVKDGAPKLEHHEKPMCKPLTDDLLDQVIEQIVAWYDAVESVLIA